MKVSSCLISILGCTLLASNGVAFAETSHTKTTEQHKTELDSGSGAVHKEHQKHEEHRAQDSHGSEAHVEQQKTHEKSKTDSHGNEVHSKQNEKKSADVHAEPDGDVSVEQKTERSEHHTAH